MKKNRFYDFKNPCICKNSDAYNDIKLHVFSSFQSKFAKGIVETETFQEAMR